MGVRIRAWRWWEGVWVFRMFERTIDRNAIVFPVPEELFSGGVVWGFGNKIILQSIWMNGNKFSIFT